MSGFNINAVNDEDVDATVKAPLQQNLSASLYVAADSNPEEEAALLRLSKTSGMPVEALRLNTNKQEAQRVSTANKYEAVVNNNPKLAAWLTDHAKARLAHDDTEDLGKIERSWGDVVSDTGASVGHGGNALMSMADFLGSKTLYPYLVEKAAASLGMDSPHKKAQEYFAWAQRNIEYAKSEKLQASNRNVDKAQGVGGTLKALVDNPLSVVDFGLQQLPQLGVAGRTMALAKGGLTGAPMLSRMAATNMAMNGALGAADAGTSAEQHVRQIPLEDLAKVSPQFNELVKSGVAPENAREQLAVQSGNVSAAVALPISMAVGQLGAKIEAKFVARLLGEQVGRMTVTQALKAAPTTVAKEFLEEGLDESLGSQMSSNIGVNRAVDPTQSITEGMDKSFALGGTLGFMGGTFPAVTEVTAAVLDRHVNTLANTEKAKLSAEALMVIDQLHSVSKVKARDSDTFNDFIDKVTADGKENVYIDANVLMQSGKAQQLAELSPSVAAQFENSLATGGEIQIPVAEYAKSIVGNPLNAEIIPNLRVEGDQFTLNQANDYETNALEILKNELSDEIEAKQNDVVFNESKDAVKQLIKEQLNNANHFTPKVNDFYAELVASRQAVKASRLGITPEEFHAQNPLFVNSSIVGENVFSQALKPIDDGAMIEATTPQASEEEIQHAQDLFLSAFSADTGKFGRQEPLLARIRKASDEAANELRGSPETRRSHAERLGAFSGYDIVADTLEGDSLNPSGSLLVRVYGKEQVAKGLTDEPALTITVRQDGELIINGPQPDSKTFDEFKKLGWADYARGKDGVVADGWSALKNTANPDKPLPLRQLIPLLADIHARVKEWRMEDHTGLHWSRSTGATGGLMNEIDRSGSGRETAVFFQFAGESARTADKFALGKAQQLLESGLSAEEVRKQTGWFNGVDGRWRFEINDADATLNPDAIKDGETSDGIPYRHAVLGELLDHPALFAAYPALREVTVSFAPKISSKGSWHDGLKGILKPTLSIKHSGNLQPTVTERLAELNVKEQNAIHQAELDVLASGGSKADLEEEIAATKADYSKHRKMLEGLITAGLDSIPMFSKENLKTILHEIQHGIQNIEGFATGGSPSEFSGPEFAKRESALAAIADINQQLKSATGDKYQELLSERAKYVKDAQSDSVDIMDRAHQKYLKLAGEIEARNTANRYELSDEQRRNASPESTADVKSNDAIVVFNGQEMQSAPAPSNAAPSPRGSFNPATSTVALLKDANLSTFLHELGHFFFENDIKLAWDLVGKQNITEGEQQIVDDVSALMRFNGLEGSPIDQFSQWYSMSFEEQRGHHERFAESFEKYVFEGKAPSIELQRLFQTFRTWMLNVYTSMKKFLSENPEAGKLSDEVRGVMDRMLATNEQIQMAESARSMMPLFSSAEQAQSLGVTIENFAKYQALGLQGTQEAIESLQARSLRDLQWIGNAQNREIKKLKAQSKEARAAVEMDVRREVMSQPIYRAWQFLTAKVTSDDKIGAKPKSNPNVVDNTQDNILTAIAKLGGISKSDAMQVWGIDPKEKPSSGVFGKPVMRSTNGLPLDMMAERLAELGYLKQDADGKADIAEFESLFNDAIRGTEVYSYAKDYADPLAGDQLTNPGALMAGRIDAVELGAMGLPGEVVNRLHELKMVGANGLHPDLIAERFEFSSGDEMLRELAVTQEPKAKIQELTDQRMLEQYGDLATPEAMAKAADKAIFNEARAKFIAAEEAALSKALGNKALLKDAAKEFAASMIDGQRLRDIKPNRYAQAEARAAKAAIAASKKGDLATAASEKRNQLVNLYAAKLAREALDEAKAADTWFKKVLGGKDDQVAKTRDMDVVNAARAVLGNFGYEGKAKTATEYLKRVAENDPEMYEVLKQSIDATEAQAKPLTEMTIAELRGLRTEVEALWHLAKRSRQLEIDGNLLDRQDAAAELVGRMTELGIPEFAQGEFSAITARERASNAIASVLALGRRVESWVDLKDGFNKMGAFRRFVWNPIKIAADKYRAEKSVRLREFRDAFDQVSTTMKKEIIFSSELNYAFGKEAGGVAMNEILHAILHTGNDSNKRKLLLGRNWAIEREDGSLDTSKWDSFVERLIKEGKLTKDHYDFAQRVWDLLDSMKPAAQKAYRDAYGKYFEEVTANAFTTPFGEYAGGYVPAKVDARVVKDNSLRKLIEDSKGAVAYSFPGTAKGFTKSRVEYNNKLMLDLRTLPQHIDQQLLFTHLENPVKDVSRLIAEKSVSSSLNRQEPTAIDSIIMPWLTRAARQQVTTPMAGDLGLSRVLNVLRQRTSMALMFGNVSNSAQQLTGFLMAGVKVPKGKMLEAAAQFIANPKQMQNSVNELSPYMAERLHSELTAIMDNIDGILLDPNIYQKANAWTKAHTFFLQSAVDRVMGPIIWTGAYNNALEEGYSADDAVLISDAVIRQTQGSTNPEDVSRMEVGPAYARLFTLFAGYFNMQANLLGTEFGKVAQEIGVRKGMGRGFYITLLGFYAPALVAELIAQAFRGGPRDDDKDGEYLDDWLMSTLMLGQLRTLTAMIPFVGQIINSGVSRFNGNPNDDKVSLSPVVSMLEGAAGVPDDVYKAAVDEGNAQKTVRDVSTLITLTTGLPANLLARPVGYLTGIAADKTEPTGAVDMARGLVTGTASPASKQ